MRCGEAVTTRTQNGSKITDIIVEFWLCKLRDDPGLTLRQLADALEHEFGVVVCPQTVKNHDGACFKLMQMHKNRSLEILSRTSKSAAIVLLVFSSTRRRE